jgi:hypothetical protein
MLYVLQKSLRILRIRATNAIRRDVSDIRMPSNFILKLLTLIVRIKKSMKLAMLIERP